MLWAVAVLLVVLWALGLVTQYTLGGFIHLLLVLAAVAIALHMTKGNRVA
ncbi:MAG: lmo0937 family membrane protein [Myxococcaceae bacterium]|nr:lmo0937 family membrane protein [Myxococcaceae bacterium]